MPINRTILFIAIFQFSIKKPPVDAKEDFAVAHGVVGSDERVVVSCEEEHVAVLHIDIGLFDVDGERQVDEWIVSDQDVVLKVKRSQCGHIRVSVVF